MSLSVKSYVHALRKAMTYWRSHDFDSHCNHLDSLAVAHSPGNDVRAHHPIPVGFWRACFTVLLCVVFSASAFADETHDLAISLLREADQIPEASARVSLRMAKAFVIAGDSSAAGRLLGEAWGASLESGEEHDTTDLQMDIVEYQVKLGQEDLAIAAAKQMATPQDRARILCITAAFLAQNGKATAAFQTMDLISAQERFQIDVPDSDGGSGETFGGTLSNFRDMAFHMISQAFYGCRDYENARKALEMIERADLKDLAKTTICTHQFERGEIKEAIQTAHTITLRDYRDSSLCEMLTCGGDQVDLATAREIYKAIKFKSHKNYAAASLAGKLSRLKQFEEAERLVNSIQDTAAKARGLQEIAIGHAANGDMEKTRAYLNQSMALTKGSQDYAIEQIVKASVKSGHYDQGQVFVQELSAPDTRSEIYELLAAAQWKQGNKEIAQRSILESQKATNEFAEPYSRSIRLRKLAVTLAGVGAKEESLATMKLALAAGLIGEPRADNLSDIATSQVAIGDIENAEATIEMAYSAARKYSKEKYLAVTLEEVVEAQAHHGNSTRAIQVAHDEMSPGLRAGLLVAAAEGLLARSSKTPPPVINHCGDN